MEMTTAPVVWELLGVVLVNVVFALAESVVKVVAPAESVPAVTRLPAVTCPAIPAPPVT